MQLGRIAVAFLIAAVIGSAGAWAGEASQPRTSTQFGAQRLDFAVGGSRAFLILPTEPKYPRESSAISSDTLAADGSKPWIWYAPTFIGGHPDPSHEWMFKQFLAKGFAIGGIEVGESFGNPKGRAAYTGFYQFVVKQHGLSPKACLLPQSRGGLMLYNWAAENPDCVRCIGGIYTLCDVRSFPGLEKACEAYGMTPRELSERLSQHNPIDRLAPLAKANVPILHVHGDVDTTVPLEENPGELARRYRSLGGSAQIVVIKDKGHEVCSEFMQCPALLEFFVTNGR